MGNRDNLEGVVVVTTRSLPGIQGRADARAVSRDIGAERRFSVLIGTLVIAAAMILAASNAWARPAPTSFADLVEKLSPAVVNISTTQKVDVSARQRGSQGSRFDEFKARFDVCQ